jgi:2-polyprenyl-3-methyl-5-hydroxy-6-metoxy-1,4-benzoquinol methylase
MQALDWRGKFDVAVCAFGIFFAEDMSSQLLRIADTVKPGGRVMISSFAKDYMQSLRSLMVARLGRFSVETPLQTWLRTAEPQACRELFAGAGLRDVEVEAKNLGYFLAGAEEWWQVVWSAGFRRMLVRLSLPDQARFKEQHLAEIEALRTPDGIWMDVPALFTIGSKPGSDG